MSSMIVNQNVRNPCARVVKQNESKQSLMEGDNVQISNPTYKPFSKELISSHSDHITDEEAKRRYIEEMKALEDARPLPATMYLDAILVYAEISCSITPVHYFKGTAGGITGTLCCSPSLSRCRHHVSSKDLSQW